MCTWLLVMCCGVCTLLTLIPPVTLQAVRRMVGSGGYYLVMHPLTPQPARPDLAAWLLQESGPAVQGDAHTVAHHSLPHGHSHGHYSHHHTPLKLPSTNGGILRLETGENMALSEADMTRSPTQLSPTKASQRNVGVALQLPSGHEPVKQGPAIVIH
jgi:hypothetical protein